jgi:hypothetical protein
MFALLQLYPLDPDEDCDVCVLAIDASRERLAQFKSAYEQRYCAALEEWDAWDDLDSEWSEAHDRKLVELMGKYDLGGELVSETRWQIVEMWNGGHKPGDEAVPPMLKLVA